MKTIVRILLLALPLAGAPSLWAQHEMFQVNPDTSKVSFTLYGTDHNMQGTFQVKSGAVDFDPRARTVAGAIVVAAGSGNSGNGSRDKRMTNAVLQAANFAEIDFWPKSYTGTLNETGDSTIQVSGVFTLHGTQHDITVPMQVHLEGEHCIAKGKFVVPYVKWGLKDPSLFLLKVAKEVNIDLRLEGTIAASH